MALREMCGSRWPKFGGELRHMRTSKIRPEDLERGVILIVRSHWHGRRARRQPLSANQERSWRDKATGNHRKEKSDSENLKSST